MICWIRWMEESVKWCVWIASFLCQCVSIGPSISAPVLYQRDAWRRLTATARVFDKCHGNSDIHACTLTHTNSFSLTHRNTGHICFQHVFEWHSSLLSLWHIYLSHSLRNSTVYTSQGYRNTFNSLQDGPYSPLLILPSMVGIKIRPSKTWK